MSRHRLPIDRANTFREHAGEAIDDEMNWPGYGLIALGIATLGMALAAAGYGFNGWALIAAVVCVSSFAVGIGLVVAEHTHVKHVEHRHLREQLGH
ncbi:hypothetical protein [Prescottella sp. R16]|uniref:hypothetical protein n=1 Tax=Prescottella sp. R16 TaxID=3064529 RepID=UPI00272EBC99|nr:hypothetical protein [Prescottella sp. R16]